MNLIHKNHVPQNESRAFHVGIVVLLAIGVFFAVRDYQYRNNKVTVHLPKIGAR